MRTVEPGEAFVTTDAMAARAHAEAQRKRHPEAAEAAYDPDGALTAAEDQKRRVARQDGLLALYDRGKISASELRAAHEIAELVGWTENDKAPIARSQFRERLDSSTGSDAGARWLWLLEAEHTRYGPWRAWACRQCVGAVGLSLETLTRAFAVEGWGVRKVEKAFRLRHGRALFFLRRALTTYVRIANW